MGSVDASGFAGRRCLPQGSRMRIIALARSSCVLHTFLRVHFTKGTTASSSALGSAAPGTRAHSNIQSQDD